MDGNIKSEQILAQAVDRTLAEQMQLTEREISARKALLCFTSEDEKALSDLGSLVAERADRIVERFYEVQLKNPEIALLIGDADTFSRLRTAMRRYVLELFEGFYDQEYVNKRLRIGKVHKRIGVSPKLYVSAILLIQAMIEDEITPVIDAWEEGNDSSRIRRALTKLLMFDMQLVFDTYISSLVAEVEVANDQLEIYAASLEREVAARTAELKEVSTRDSLTGLYNQRAFYELLRREISVAERSQSVISLAYLDLNGFKKLNDSNGHREGDRILRLVGDAIRKTVREIDMGCRYGGDEFCIVMPRTGIKEGEKVCARLIKIFSDMDSESVTMSIGLVETGPNDFIDTDVLVSNADKLMYRAKAKSKKKFGNYIEVPKVKA